MAVLSGKSASPGIALGKVLLIPRDCAVVQRRSIQSVSAEQVRFRAAVEASMRDLGTIKNQVLAEIDADKAAIFEAHLLMLEDPELISGVENKIESEKMDAESALSEVADYFIRTFEGMDNEYLRERAADVSEVAQRILRHLQGKKTVDLSCLREDVVLVAHDLTASQTATLDKRKVLGILTDVGGKTSHTAIMARTLEIPAVLGLQNITELVHEGDLVALDGELGEVIVQPDTRILETYRARKQTEEHLRNELKAFIGLPTITEDGRTVCLEANIGTVDDLALVQKNDAEGVGLYRTEFLFMNRTHAPTEQEQFESYKAILTALSPRPVTIRTLDIGGDKALEYLHIEKEENPFLGCRAIRYCLREREVFKTQLRALLRASVYGNLAILFPLITTLGELLEAKKILEETKSELRDLGISYSDSIQIGVMIEVPSAAMISDILAKYVDFFSIGTNDLIQYTCAVDRLNGTVNALYDPFHPAVLRLIHLVIKNAQNAGISVAMCGEMAGDPKLIPMLLAFGLTEFSMNPAFILRARKIIRGLSYEKVVETVPKFLGCEQAADVQDLLRHCERSGGT